MRLGRILGYASALPLYMYILKRKIEFAVLMRIANRRVQEIDNLIAFLAHPIISKSKAEVKVFRNTQKRPGYPLDETKTPGPICWETPLNILFYLDDIPVFGMGIEIRGRILSIKQLQGIPGAPIPRAIKMWPRFLVKASMEWVAYAGMREVRLYNADQSLAYIYPQVSEESLNRSEAIRAIRERMRRRYDGTAMDLGFTRRRKYSVWQVSSARP